MKFARWTQSHIIKTFLIIWLLKNQITGLSFQSQLHDCCGNTELLLQRTEARLWQYIISVMLSASEIKQEKRKIKKLRREWEILGVSYHYTQGVLRRNKQTRSEESVRRQSTEAGHSFMAYTRRWWWGVVHNEVRKENLLGTYLTTKCKTLMKWCKIKFK